MTFDETKEILSILKLNYMGSFTKMDSTTSHQFLNLWSEAFKDDDVRLVVKAVKSIIYSDTRDFAPNIGQVKEKMFQLSGVTQTDVGDAWERVYRNISCNRQYAKDNFEQLPANIQKALGTYAVLVEIGYMDNNAVNFARRDFEKRYNSVLEKERGDLISGFIDTKQLELNNTMPRTKENVIGFNIPNLIANKI